MTNSFRSCGLAVLALLGAACTTTTTQGLPVVRGPGGDALPPPEAAKPAEEEAAQTLAAEAARLEATGDQAGAEAKRDLLARDFPGTAAGAQVLQERARAADEAGQAGKALELYESLLFHRPSCEGCGAVRERYAALLLQNERVDDAVNMLAALYKGAAGTDRPRLGLAYADALVRASKAREALAALVELYGLSDITPAVREQLVDGASDIVKETLSFKEAETAWKEVEGNKAYAFVHPVLAFRLAKIYYHIRDYERSEAMLRLVSTRFASSRYGEPAREFLTRLRARYKVEPLAIGVVLPLSGSFEQYGKRSLAAIEMAFGPNSPYKLVVKDTEAEAAGATKAVEDLVLEDHVIAIIGPLFSKEALAAAIKAEDLGVPIIALSHREGLPQIGPWVFRTALTVEAQAQALARLAFEDLGMTRFALLYPRNRYGIDFTEAFWAEVDKRKGEVRAAESYEPDQTTFQEPVRKLVGRWYTMARDDYREGVRAIREQKLPSHRERMALDKLDQTLAPIVDFDAVVIPDSARNLENVAAALDFEDIVLTRDPKMLERIRKAMGHEVKPVSLLGGSTWNSPQTVENCEKCEHALFVDAYYSDSPDPKVRDFVTAFRDKTAVGDKPGADPQLGEALAHDTAGLLKSVLLTDKPTTRKALAEKLLKLSGFEGLTGKMRFNADGEVEKKLFVLTIEEKMIKPWDGSLEPPRG